MFCVAGLSVTTKLDLRAGAMAALLAGHHISTRILQTLLLFTYLPVSTSTACSNLKSSLSLFMLNGTSLVSVTDSTKRIPWGEHSVGDRVIQGPAMWIIHNGSSWNDPKILLSHENIEAEYIALVEDAEYISIERVGLTCPTRPVGVMSRYLIDDSDLFTGGEQHGVLPAGRLGSCCLSVGESGWLMMFLGAFYRIYAIANRGHMTETGCSYTGTYWFAYRIQPLSESFLTENGVNKLFIGNSEISCTHIIKHEISPTVIASYVRIEVSTDIP